MASPAWGQQCPLPRLLGITCPMPRPCEPAKPVLQVQLCTPPERYSCSKQCWQINPSSVNPSHRQWQEPRSLCSLFPPVAHHQPRRINGGSRAGVGVLLCTPRTGSGNVEGVLMFVLAVLKPPGSPGDSRLLPQQINFHSVVAVRAL